MIKACFPLSKRRIESKSAAVETCSQQSLLTSEVLSHSGTRERSQVLQRSGIRGGGGDDATKMSR